MPLDSRVSYEIHGAIFVTVCLCPCAAHRALLRVYCHNPRTIARAARLGHGTVCHIFQALRQARGGQKVFKAFAIAVGIAWLIAVTRDSGLELVSWTSAAATAGIAASMGISNVLHFMEQKLTYTDYVHAERG